LRTNLLHISDNQKKELGEKIDKLESNQNTLLEIDRNLKEQLATNQFINPDLRERIIESNAKFEELGLDVTDVTNMMTLYREKLKDRRELLEIQKQEKHNNKLASWKRCSPCFDYAIKTLADITTQIAKKRGDNAISNYKGTLDFTNWDTGPENVAEIKLKNSPDWDFRVSAKFTDWDGRFFLTIKCEDNSLDVAPVGDRVDTIVHLSDGNDIENQEGFDQYKKTITEGLDYLIGAVAEKAATTNK
jgi:hypothetical protein